MRSWSVTSENENLKKKTLVLFKSKKLFLIFNCYNKKIISGIPYLASKLELKYFY